MKRMTWILTTMLAVAMTTAAFAATEEAPVSGPGKGPHPRGPMPLLPPRVEKELALTADQQAKLATINADFAKERDAWLEKNKPDPKLRDDLRAAREAGDTEQIKALTEKMHEHNKPLMDLRKKYVDQFRTTLTDDQKTKLDTSLTEAKHRMGEPHKGPKPGGE